MLAGPISLYAALAFLLATVNAALDLAFDDDGDLSHYVTRPEIKAPLFEVAIYEPERITPGYWFVAPYVHILQDRMARKYYQPCQTGPAIYDASGELVWSGACVVGNQNTCDFRVFTANGSDYLSAIVTHWPSVDPIGHGIILDGSMQIKQRLDTPNTLTPFNMHEFNVLDDGKTGMHIVQKVEVADVSHLDANGQQSGLVINMGIREFDLHTNKTIFMWWAQDYVNLNASSFPPRFLNGPFPNGWDWLHLNAIDKSPEGDYLVTARYTDAVYKVSGKDGHIMWSLGGTTSSFQLQDFNFSRPHDARFVSTGETTQTITLLDNGGCEESKTSDVSSALIIDLDMSSEPWTAKVQKRWTRPDNGRSDKRGNFQLLPNGNAFIGWSENSYMTEHPPSGDLLMQAQFTSTRFVTYRSYKFNFTSAPSEPPIMKGFVYGEDEARSVSVYYVSWNGATEVSRWEFYSGGGELLGSVARTGFETMFQQSARYVETVYAQAVDRNGDVLGKSKVVHVVAPASWERPREDEMMGARGGKFDRSEL
ncbi:hypothetical protein DOTSEDRAFT_57685 [Dothistroma septosporum NZE10]|uniref:ASST-domain-containing protein n=1 Tax=Dothistroma septosporum (strain NZE10 / CBS 128990) TaxID=675120 RepID=M2XZS0_DOTSN|nr:hypothetical protein DOTSEDRAFT_57685 [Dothistroma septosporum NZE10]